MLFFFQKEVNKCAPDSPQSCECSPAVRVSIGLTSCDIRKRSLAVYNKANWLDLTGVVIKSHLA